MQSPRRSLPSGLLRGWTLLKRKGACCWGWHISLCTKLCHACVKRRSKKRSEETLGTLEATQLLGRKLSESKTLCERKKREREKDTVWKGGAGTAQSFPHTELLLPSAFSQAQVTAVHCTLGFLKHYTRFLSVCLKAGNKSIFFCIPETLNRIKI